MTAATWLTPRIRVSSWSSAALSAVVSPPSRAAMSVDGASDTSWNGAAIAAACMLGELAGRKPLVVSLATSASDGRKRTARNVTAIQATTMRNRKRTANCPRLVKKRFIPVLSSTEPGARSAGVRHE